MMDAILEYLKAEGRAAGVFDIADALQLPADEVDAALKELVRLGGAVLTRKGRYALPSSMGLVPAKTLVLRSGAPVARPLDGGRDMMIRHRGELRPMVDDQILVQPEPDEGEGMGRCRLMAITKRAHERFEAVLTFSPVKTPAPRKKNRKGKGAKREKRTAQATFVAEVHPVDERISSDIQLTGDLQGARSGDMVLLRVTRWPSRGVKLVAEIEAVMGEAKDVRVQLRAVAFKHNLRTEFPPEVMKQAKALGTEVTDEDRKGRKDLRALKLFTIDGDDAQDFDDAVSLEVIEGGYQLGVHIADVSHYVKRSSPIDQEALERGTSVYLPGLTYPMLPEALSNNLCSLMPDVDRLAMSLIMTVKNGAVVDHEISPSVIHSSARLTYNQVNRLFAKEDSGIDESLHGTLHQMLELSHILREKRHARGSLDFDLPEAAFTLDSQGEPTDVRARERGESEKLIEDFMLLANETVAELARNAELPMIYRVHEKPSEDRLRAFQTFVEGLGIQVPALKSNPRPGELQKIMEATKDLKEARLINQVLLRSLKRAEYRATPDGHYGLAAKDYCHFTSPIRRYPDLEVHRMLKLFIKGNAKAYASYEKRMPDLALRLSQLEQQATLAERDADDLLKAHYIRGHIGEVYTGLVTGVTSWGLYVTLENTVEGLVHVRTLNGYYELDEQRYRLVDPMRGHQIRLGDAVTIRVESVNLSAVQVDFSYLSEDAPFDDPV